MGVVKAKGADVGSSLRLIVCRRDNDGVCALIWWRDGVDEGCGVDGTTHAVVTHRRSLVES